MPTPVLGSGTGVSAAPQSSEVDLWVLCTALDSSAKRWWGATFLVRLVGFILGTVSVLGWGLSPSGGVLAVALSGVVAELLGFRVGAIRSTAQSLRRKLEFRDAFGWEIAGDEQSDLLARVADAIQRRIAGKKLEDPYFASAKPQGPERGLENLTESAWWSKHLAENMRNLVAGGIAVLVAGSIAILVFALQRVDDALTRDAIARVVTGALLLLFSLGLVHLVVAYHRFSSAAARVERSASDALKHPPAESIETMKLWHEYQVSRALGPIVPEWLWRYRRHALNRLWKQHRRLP